MENGKVALLNNLKNGIGFGSTEFHVSRLTDLTNKKYFFYYVVQESFRREARRNMTGSAGQLRVPTSYFKDVLIPLCPLPEQHQIVAEIERCFSIADDVERTVDQSLQQAERLRQSILKQAFIGQLVPQDPTNEPAAVLLERIKAEKARRVAEQKAARRTKKPRKKKPVSRKKTRNNPTIQEEMNFNGK